MWVSRFGYEKWTWRPPKRRKVRQIINFLPSFTNSVYRQANIDFVVFSALFGLVLCMLTLSYDICCQWSRNLATRVKQLPPSFQPDPQLLSQAKRVLPKMHLHNHVQDCQLNFNLNYIRYSAQSDFEDPERYWSWANGAGPSTREMTDGACYEVIGDHAAAWNWRKVVTFGKYCICVSSSRS